MNPTLRTAVLFLLFFTEIKTAFSQQDLLSLIPADKPKKEYITNAFKSTRVINSHSMEFLGQGVLDFRITHRFGPISDGGQGLYGFDQAKTRLGLDYGVLKSLMVGIGRSTLGKELDAFLKFRPVWQSTGPGSFPVSIVIASSITLDPTAAPPSDTLKYQFYSSRLAFYNGLIIGRKFSEGFSLQLTPELLHRNLVDSTWQSNNIYSVGIGARLKLSKRIALVVDYHHILYGLQQGTYQDPLAVGVDIETGGHVFQLHFSNSQGMNERAVITQTTDKWGSGGIRFGFTISRVFTIVKYKPKTISTANTFEPINAPNTSNATTPVSNNTTNKTVIPNTTNSTTTNSSTNSNSTIKPAATVKPSGTAKPANTNKTTNTTKPSSTTKPAKTTKPAAKTSKPKPAPSIERIQ